MCIYFSPRFFDLLIITTLNSCLGYLPVSSSLSSSSGDLSCSLITWSMLFCHLSLPGCCLYFYVSLTFVMFSSLEGVAICRWPEAHSALVTQAISSRSFPYEDGVGSSIVVGCVGSMVGFSFSSASQSCLTLGSHGV